MTSSYWWGPPGCITARQSRKGLGCMHTEPDSWGRLAYSWGNQLTVWGLILRVPGDTDADYLLCKQFIRIIDTVDSRLQDLWERLGPLGRVRVPFQFQRQGKKSLAKCFMRSPLLFSYSWVAARGHFSPWFYGFIYMYVCMYICHSGYATCNPYCLESWWPSFDEVRITDSQVDSLIRIAVISQCRS